MKSIIKQCLIVISILVSGQAAYAASISTQVGCALGVGPGFGGVSSIDCGKVYQEKAFAPYKYGNSHALINADYGQLHAFADAQASVDNASAAFIADMHDTLVFKHPTAKTVSVTVNLWVEGDTFANDSSIPNGEVSPHAAASAYAEFTASADFVRNKYTMVQLYSGAEAPRRGFANPRESLTFTMPVNTNVGWYLHLEGGASAKSYVNDPSKATTLYKSFIDMQNTTWLQVVLNDPLTTFTSESGSLYAGPAAVPEPSTFAMMGIGLGLFAWRRKQFISVC